MANGIRVMRVVRFGDKREGSTHQLEAREHKCRRSTRNPAMKNDEMRREGSHDLLHSPCRLWLSSVLTTVWNGGATQISPSEEGLCVGVRRHRRAPDPRGAREPSSCPCSPASPSIAKPVPWEMGSPTALRAARVALATAATAASQVCRRNRTSSLRFFAWQSRPQ